MVVLVAELQVDKMEMNTSGFNLRADNEELLHSKEQFQTFFHLTKDKVHSQL